LSDEIKYEEVSEPQYYVDFSDKGNIAGFYVDEIHGDNIPTSALPITIEQWQDYVADSHLYRLDENGETIRLKTAEELATEQAELPPIPKSPEQLRMEALEAENSDLKSRLGDVELIMADLLMGGGE